MLRILTSTIRGKAARYLAAFYIVCLVLPTLALALTNATAAVPDLSEAHPASGAIHIHADGVVHDHAEHSPDQKSGTNGGSDPGSCCGVFCLNAISESRIPPVGPLPATADCVVWADSAGNGRAPDLIHRPPISLASL